MSMHVFSYILNDQIVIGILFFMKMFSNFLILFSIQSMGLNVIFIPMWCQSNIKLWALETILKQGRDFSFSD